MSDFGRREEVKPDPALTIKLPFLSPIDLTPLIPTPALILRSAAVASVLVTSLTIAVIAWVVFYAAVGVKVGHHEQVWLQYGHYRAPYAHIPLVPAGGFLASDQAYNVKLDVLVPTSTRNVELGNFMVNLNLLRSDGSAAFNVSRPASLAYRSPITLALSAMSPLSLIKSPDIQHLSISLIESTVLQTRRSIPTLAYVELGRRDAHRELEKWDGGNGELQVYKASLRFDAELGGIRYILYHHPIILFFIFVPTFLFFELLSCSIIWAIFASRSSSTPISPPSSRYAPSTTSSSEETKPFATRDRIEWEEARAREQEARVRRGVKMELEELSSESSESGSRSDEGSRERSGLGGHLEVKTEDEEEEIDDKATVGGSTTTRGTLSSFGPSLAPTATTSSTAPSGSGARRRTTPLSRLDEE